MKAATGDASSLRGGGFIFSWLPWGLPWGTINTCSAEVAPEGTRETGLAQAESSREREEGKASWKRTLPLTQLLSLPSAVPPLSRASASPSVNQQLNSALPSSPSIWKTPSQGQVVRNQTAWGHPSSPGSPSPHNASQISPFYSSCSSIDPFIGRLVKRVGSGIQTSGLKS